MFLSKLIPNPRSREVRRDLGDPYELHRTLLKCLPGERSPEACDAMFRVELRRDEPPVILVQTRRAPEWTLLAADYCLEKPDSKPLNDLTFPFGSRYLFRLRANPTKKIATQSKQERESALKKCNGKRLGLLTEPEQVRWLIEKGRHGGFRIPHDRHEDSGIDFHHLRVLPQGFVRSWKGGHEMKFLAVQFEGILEVTDTEAFRLTLANGVGSAKGLGFGLLSVGRPAN